MYILKRACVGIAVLLLAVTLNFWIIRAAPGNYADYVVASQASIARGGDYHAKVVEQFGLDESAGRQFVDYLNQLARGNLGTSFLDQQPVTSKLWTATKSTLPMLMGGLVLGILLGIGLGILAATWRGGWLDGVIVGSATIVYSLPVQWIGMILLLVFAGTLPLGGSQDLFLVDASFMTAVWDRLKHLILPCLTLGLATFGGYALIVRSAMLEALGEDFVLTARAQGFRARQIVIRDVLRNAMLPIVTLIALSFGAILGGAILIEVVFSWPGLGLLARDAVSQRDYPVVQGTFLLYTAGVVFFNFMADVLYTRLDPRVRTT